MLAIDHPAKKSSVKKRIVTREHAMNPQTSGLVIATTVTVISSVEGLSRSLNDAPKKGKMVSLMSMGIILTI